VSRFHHAVGKQVISAKKKLEDAGVLNQQKFVNPEDSNDSEAAAPEQEGGSRGIQRRRRALTQRENRRRAFDAALEHSNEQWRNDEEFESVEQGQAALQPVTDASHQSPRKMNLLTTEQGNREYPVPDSPFMEQRLVDLIREAEHSGEEENYDRVEAMRKALATYRAINERKRRREREITRQATLAMQGSGVIAGMGFATYLG
jgi:hypothetical protein